MAFPLSEKSRLNLRGVHPDLVRVIERVTCSPECIHSDGVNRPVFAGGCLD
jgi:hypothetical protein